jgi:hypothetical protein
MTYSGDPILHYQNKYGRIEFDLVSEVRHVSTIHGVDIDDQYKFDIRTAEQVALITDNRRIQICPQRTPKGYVLYVVLHATPSTVAVGRIKDLVYVGGDPTQAIQDERRRDF